MVLLLNFECDIQLTGPMVKISKRRLVASPAKVRQVEKKVDDSWAERWLDEWISLGGSFDSKPAAKSYGQGKSANVEPWDISLPYESPYDGANMTASEMHDVSYDTEEWSHGSDWDSTSGEASEKVWENGWDTWSNGQDQMPLSDEENDPDDQCFNHTFPGMDAPHDLDELHDPDEPYDLAKPNGYEEESYDPCANDGWTVDGMAYQPGGIFVPIEQDKTYITNGVCSENTQDDLVYVDGANDVSHFLNILDSEHHGSHEYSLVSVKKLTVPQGETLLSFQKVLVEKHWTHIALSAHGSIGIEYGTDGS